MSQHVAQPMSRIDDRVPLHVRDRVTENKNIIRLNRQEQQMLAQALAGESSPELSDFVQQVAKEYKERMSRS